MNSEHMEDVSNPYLQKAMIIGRLVNQVGLPSVVIIVMLTWFTAVVFAWVPTPWVSKSEFVMHVEVTQSMLEQAKANTMATKQMVEAIRAMNCELKVNKLACYRSLNESESSN